MNLKKEYRDFLKKAASQIKELNIDSDLTKEKCLAIYKLYQLIYSEVDKSETININDINHIILNYSKDDKDVELFRKFIKIKNLYQIIKQSLQSLHFYKFKKLTF